MPLVYAAIEAPTPVVQEKALRVVPGLAEALDYTTVKNSLFPRVQVSCSSSWGPQVVDITA